MSLRKRGRGELHDDVAAAIVINISSARCRVFRDGREFDCIVPPEIAARQKSALAVGDRVLVDDDMRLAAILPRRTVLSRPDPLNPRLERLIAANIEVVACSTKTGEGLDELRAAVSGKTSALVGHSGVGKSSILNALDERLRIATGDLHRRGTGRHTTSSSTLHDLGGGTLIIDTPGIREFGLWDLTPRALRASFPDFDVAAELCRFNDCTHLHEPACEVKERVARGELSRARYDTYVRLTEDLSCEKP